MFSSFNDQNKKKQVLLVQTLNKETLIPNSDVRQVSVIDYKDVWDFDAEDFTFTTSLDDSKLLIYHSLPTSSGKPETYRISVFDTKVQLLWSNDITLEYSNKLFRIDDLSVSNNGEVFVLGLHFKDKVFLIMSIMCCHMEMMELLRRTFK